ncbi:MAG: hypothetical protein N2C14_25395, partial [Planctomycetales bacterium]
PVYVEAAAALAKRVVKDMANESLDAQLDYAFQLCTARRPTDSERDLLKDFYRSQVKAGKNRAKGATKTAAEADGWRGVATVLLNMHETITKD